jgi:hypothetical protein
VGGEGVSHVLVAMIFLVDEMVGGRDMVVTVGLHTTNCIFFLKLKIFDKLRQQSFLPRHLLKAREQTCIRW